MTTAPQKPVQAARGGSPDLTGARADLAELEALLRHHRLVYDPLLVRLRGHLSGYTTVELERLCAQIQAFDDKRALATLIVMRELLR